MFLDSILTLAVIMLLSFSIYGLFRLNACVTPLVSISCLVCAVTVFAYANMLFLGVILCFIAVLLIFIFTLYKNKNRLSQLADGFFTPGVLFFIVFSLALFVLFSIKRPILNEWDEFSFWGISQKLVKSHEALYTFYPSSMIGKTTPPALAVLVYIFQSFSAGYTEWKAFFAYDVLFFACFSAFSAKFGRKQWHSAFMLYLFGFLTPFIFEIYTKIIYLQPTYITTYADIPLGVVFAGVLAVYFFSCDNNSRDILPLLPIVAMLTLIKDMGFALSCIVVFIVFFDLCIGKNAFVFLKLKGFLAKISATFSIFACTIAAFLSWALHMKYTMGTNRFELGGENNVGMVQMLLLGVKEIFSPQKSQKFIDMSLEMKNAFFHREISMFGSGVIVVGIIFAIFIFSMLICRDKAQKKRTLTMLITSTIGFIGYYIFHLFLYVYIFKSNAYGLPSYTRYIYPYYMGWLTLAVISLCLCLGYDRTKGWCKAVLFGFVLLSFWRFSQLTNYENLFISYNDTNFYVRKSVSAKYDVVESSVGKDDVVYCYSADDADGQRWFIYTYELAPNIVVRDFPFAKEQGVSQEQAGRMWAEQFVDFLRKNNVTHLLLDYSGGYLSDVLSDSFPHDPDDIGNNAVGYYKIDYSGSNGITFNLVKRGIVNG